MSESENIDLERGHSLWGEAWHTLRKSWMAMSCLMMLGVFCITALYGSAVYWRYNIIDADVPVGLVKAQKALAWMLRAEQVKGQQPPYDVQNLDIQYQKPGRVTWTTREGERREKLFLMGTDGLGRDVFLRLVQGARIAFQVGIITSLIAIFIGVLLGCVGGYFGGWVDDVIVWFYSTIASLPSLLFILSIAMIVGKGLMGVYLGVGLTTWVRICRLVRGEVMKNKELTYVRAARVAGLGPLRIMFRHILPNVFHIVIINFSLSFPAAIETEVIMSFLGIGVQGDPSWGIMISNARFRLWHGVWWELAFTSLAIFLVVLAFNLLGDALRDALDPRLRTRTET